MVPVEQEPASRCTSLEGYHLRNRLGLASDYKHPAHAVCLGCWDTQRGYAWREEHASIMTHPAPPSATSGGPGSECCPKCIGKG